MPSSKPLVYARRSPAEQLSGLRTEFEERQLPCFSRALAEAGTEKLRVGALRVLQVNLGKMCNQTCKHCHVDAGPRRKEIMTRETMHDCLEAIDRLGVSVVDLTGGAPEMNPDFRWFVEQIRKHRTAQHKPVHIMVRCNLTIIVSNPKYYSLPSFYAKHGIEVISSLPHFMATRTDAQRGKGVFSQSLDALRRLQAVGYGKANSGLLLHLVYNPAGAFLPASQEELSQEFKLQLRERYDLDFNDLYVITNLPISRFYDYLEQSDNLGDYMDKLVNAFNPKTLDGLMCRDTLSVSWDGLIYDCDFNQMLDLEIEGVPHIRKATAANLSDRAIRTDNHCYGCTAGAGSSCGGEIA